jgi:hypothetical protein
MRRQFGLILFLVISSMGLGQVAQGPGGKECDPTQIKCGTTCCLVNENCVAGKCINQCTPPTIACPNSSLCCDPRPKAGTQPPSGGEWCQATTTNGKTDYKCVVGNFTAPCDPAKHEAQCGKFCCDVLRSYCAVNTNPQPNAPKEGCCPIGFIYDGKGCVLGGPKCGADPCPGGTHCCNPEGGKCCPDNVACTPNGCCPPSAPKYCPKAPRPGCYVTCPSSTTPTPQGTPTIRPR